MFYSKEFHKFISVPAETFLPIDGFSGYEVSSHGRVLSRKGKQPRIMTNAVSTRGYLHVILYRDGRAHDRHVHRLVLEAFEGVAPPGHEARHLDGCATNCMLSNLAWSSHKANVADKRRHGTHIPRARLSDEEVRDILTTAAHEKTRDQAERMGIPPYIVSDVRCGYTYRHIAPDLPRGFSKRKPR